MGKSRNLAIDLTKLILACLIVFIHLPFPGRKGQALEAVGRIAVPYFFMISGYYSCTADKNRILRRLDWIVRILLFSAAMYLFWLMVRGKYITGTGMRAVLKKHLTWENLASLLIINKVSVTIHLWYLAAMAECYCLLLAYRQFFVGEQVNYRPLYMLSFSMLALHTAGSAAMQCCGITVDEELFRNVWFFGMPMFSMGIFLQQYGEKIVKNYRLTVKKGAAVIAAGALLSVLQFLAIAKNELPIGMVPASAVLLLLTVYYPVYVREENRFLYRLSDAAHSLSLTVYIVHPLLQKMLKAFRKTVPIAGTVWSWN